MKWKHRRACGTKSSLLPGRGMPECVCVCVSVGRGHEECEFLHEDKRRPVAERRRGTERETAREKERDSVRRTGTPPCAGTHLQPHFLHSLIYWPLTFAVVWTDLRPSASSGFMRSPLWRSFSGFRAERTHLKSNKTFRCRNVPLGLILVPASLDKQKSRFLMFLVDIRWFLHVKL